jgi:hypothetical protein
MDDRNSEWPVAVFRSTLRGWEELRPRSRTQVQRPVRSTTAQFRSRSAPLVGVRATPLRGSIVLRRVKARFRFRPSSVAPSSAGASAIASPLVTDEGTMILTRRHDRIVLRNIATSSAGASQEMGVASTRPQGSPRVFMLQFQSIKDCVAFCDRFKDLNPFDSRQMPIDKMSPFPPLSMNKRINETGAPITSASQDIHGGELNRGGVPPTQHQSISNDSLFYISRLLVDDEFASFVRDIDRIVTSRPDSCKLLDALLTK